MVDVVQVQVSGGSVQYRTSRPSAREQTECSVYDCGKYVSVKVDCGMNARQSSYLPSVHHVMGHVTRDNCPSNKKSSVLGADIQSTESCEISEKKKKRNKKKKKKEIEEIMFFFTRKKKLFSERKECY